MVFHLVPVFAEFRNGLHRITGLKNVACLFFQLTILNVNVNLVNFKLDAIFNLWLQQSVCGGDAM